MFIRRGDWLLCEAKDGKLDDFAIFSLVLATSESFTKLARWQSFGRFRISDVTIPTSSVKRYYTKIGSFNKMDKHRFDQMLRLVSTLSEDALINRGKDIFEYSKVLYKQNKGHTLESLIKKRRERIKERSLEKDILKCFYHCNPPTEECRIFLKDLQKCIERLYKDNGYYIYRSIDGKLEDIIKRD